MNALFNHEHFEALPNSKPVLLSEVTKCRWPIGHSSPYLFCNNALYRVPATQWAVGKVSNFCEVHHRMAYVPNRMAPRTRP